MQKKTQSNQEVEDEEIIHHAGDKGFKAVMQVKESALEYMEKFFPKLYAHLDLDNFELDTTNYVKRDFKEFYSDVVYRTSLKNTENSSKKSKRKRKPVKVVLLFEHKKTIDSYFLLILQLLEYIVSIWRNDVQNKRKPSVIIPIVVYQGKKGLKPRELHDLFKHVPDELRQYLPNLKLLLTNVHDLLDENILALEEKGLLRSLILTLKEKTALQICWSKSLSFSNIVVKRSIFFNYYLILFQKKIILVPTKSINYSLIIYHHIKKKML